MTSFDKGGLDRRTVLGGAAFAAGLVAMPAC